MASLGEQLRGARRAKGKSLEDISNDTNISKGYLEALEKDDYDKLPGDVYVVGFLGAYARSVGLDPDAVVEQHHKLMAFNELLDKETSGTTSHRRKTRRVNRKRVVMLLIAVIFIALCLAVLLWLRRV